MAQITPEQTTKAIHPVLGIMGGLGPAASCYLYQMITDHTPAQKDQDHIDIVISSRASTPDRTAFIVGKSKDDPFDVMEQDGISLVRYGATVLAIACHTAGKPGMSRLDKIVYLADMSSKERDWPGVNKLRKLELKDLDLAMLAAIRQTNDFVLSQDKPLDPMSKAAYDEIKAEVDARAAKAG